MRSLGQAGGREKRRPFGRILLRGVRGGCACTFVHLPSQNGSALEGG